MRKSIIFAALAGIALNAASLPPLTTADLYKLQSVVDVQLSRNADAIAFTRQSSEAPGRPLTEIWTGPTRRLDDARRVGEGSDPRWSPDGKQLAFVGRTRDGSGLFVGGDKPKLLARIVGTNHPLPSTGEELAWSPDGRHIAFVSATDGPEQKATGDPAVITRYLYKPTASEGSTRFNDNRRLHIFIVDVAAAAVRQLTQGNYYEHSIDWSPSGDEIVFVSNRGKDPDRFFNYDILAVRVSDGAVRRITETKSAEYYPRWSPDGSRIAFLGTKRDLTSSETTMEDTHVWTMKADGSGREEVGAIIDNRQGPPRWVNNELAFTVQERGRVNLYRAGRRVPLEGSVAAWSVAGPTVAAALATETHPAELAIATAGGEERASAARANGWLEKVALAGVESFTFKSFDGLEVEAFLTKPVGVGPSRKYPLVAVVHGGPHGQQGPWFNSKAQIYAGAGFATLMVNYRGSTGYGQKFADAIFGDQNGGEAKDVLGGVSAACAKYPWIDRNALFIEGVSYGGQLTNWIVTETARFKAAVSTAGISNLVSFNYMAYYHDYLAVEFGAYPHERGLIDKLWERSPIRYAKEVKTPVLFLHGENDNDVPIAEAEQFYIALKDVGVDTAMVRYPREGHGVRETRHVADAIDRSLAWYRKHL